jgi:hypothetical protein
MSGSLQQQLESLDRKTEHSLESQSVDWVMKGVPPVPPMTEERISKALKPGVLLRVTRGLTTVEAEAVVADAYKRFGEDSLYSPLCRLFSNPIAPVDSDEDRPTLHPIAFSLVVMICLLVVLFLVVHNM